MLTIGEIPIKGRLAPLPTMGDQEVKTNKAKKVTKKVRHREKEQSTLPTMSLRTLKNRTPLELGEEQPNLLKTSDLVN